MRILNFRHLTVVNDFNDERDRKFDSWWYANPQLTIRPTVAWNIGSAWLEPIQIPLREAVLQTILRKKDDMQIDKLV